MSKGLEAFERIKRYVKEACNPFDYPDNKPHLDTIEKELKELNKIKARLVVVNMKLNSKREECVQNIEHTDEDTFMHEASKITIDCLDWVREMLKEVL